MDYVKHTVVREPQAMEARVAENQDTARSAGMICRM